VRAAPDIEPGISTSLVLRLHGDMCGFVKVPSFQKLICVKSEATGFF
jgi:hypothetical protein